MGAKEKRAAGAALRGLGQSLFDIYHQKKSDERQQNQLRAREARDKRWMADRDKRDEARGKAAAKRQQERWAREDAKAEKKAADEAAKEANIYDPWKLYYKSKKEDIKSGKLTIEQAIKNFAGLKREKKKSSGMSPEEHDRREKKKEEAADRKRIRDAQLKRKENAIRDLSVQWKNKKISATEYADAINKLGGGKGFGKKEKKDSLGIR
jgi:hypothetical protein